MKVSDQIIEKINDMLSVYVCPELQQAAKAFLESAEKTGEADPTALIAELKEDICSIDSFIGFTQSDYCKNMKGEEEAELMYKAGIEAKANGARICLCPGCTKANELLGMLVG
jgi:hypothetical protein